MPEAAPFTNVMSPSWHSAWTNTNLTGFKWSSDIRFVDCTAQTTKGMT